MHSPSCFFNNHFNITFHVRVCPRGLCLVYPPKPCKNFSSPSILPYVPTISVLFDLGSLKYLKRLQTMKIPIRQFPELFSYLHLVSSTRFPRTLISDLSRFSSLNIRIRVSHPYKTAVRILVIFI
jgi:hypothetical protein